MKQLPVQNTQPAIEISDAELLTLKNGMQLYLLPANEFAVMRLTLLFRAGSSHQSVPFSASATANLLAEGSEAMTARELVALGRAPYTDWMGRLTAEDNAAVERAIEVVGIAELADRYIDTLSDGECQRVMIARALAQQTPVILLDEPTAFLDMPNRYELCTLLRRIAHDQGKCIVFSTHELDIALSLADNIALVDTPHLRYMTTDEMIASGAIERLFDSRHVSFDAATRSIQLR